MPIKETLENWDRLASQVPYRLEGKESLTPVHMPVAHPDRDPASKDPKVRVLTCPPITWADLKEVMEFVRAHSA